MNSATASSPWRPPEVSEHLNCANCTINYNQPVAFESRPIMPTLFPFSLSPSKPSSTPPVCPLTLYSGLALVRGLFKSQDAWCLLQQEVVHPIVCRVDQLVARHVLHMAHEVSQVKSCLILVCHVIGKFTARYHNNELFWRFTSIHPIFICP